MWLSNPNLVVKNTGPMLARGGVGSGVDTQPCSASIVVLNPTCHSGLEEWRQSSERRSRLAWREAKCVPGEPGRSCEDTWSGLEAYSEIIARCFRDSIPERPERACPVPTCGCHPGSAVSRAKE